MVMQLCKGGITRKVAAFIYVRVPYVRPLYMSVSLMCGLVYVRISYVRPLIYVRVPYVQPYICPCPLCAALV